MILLDANVLVYAVNRAAPQHQRSRQVVEASLEERIPAALVPQVLTEAYAVLTDPRRVEHPLEPATAWKEIDTLRQRCPVLPVVPEVLDVLGDLVGSVDVRGQDVFDAFLVAQMRHHGVRSICTYNVDDFAAFPGIEAITPARVRIQRRRPRG